MRTVLCLALLLVAVCGLTGCFTMDAEHNKRHWEIVKADFQELHADADFVLGLDEPTMLESKYR